MTGRLGEAACSPAPRVAAVVNRMPNEGVDGLIDLRDRLRAFAADREWGKFHSPKNLAVALSVEAGELLELFLWRPEEEMLDPDAIRDVSEEIADVLIYLVMLADRIDVDLIDAAARKVDVNEVKYPVEKAKGSAKKYGDL